MFASGYGTGVILARLPQRVFYALAENHLGVLLKEALYHVGRSRLTRKAAERGEDVGDCFTEAGLGGRSLRSRRDVLADPRSHSPRKRSYRGYRRCSVGAVGLEPTLYGF